MNNTFFRMLGATYHYDHAVPKSVQRACGHEQDQAFAEHVRGLRPWFVIVLGTMNDKMPVIEEPLVSSMTRWWGFEHVRKLSEIIVQTVVERS